MMRNFCKDIQTILRGQEGIALMMIMTAILLLMAIYGEFTFDSKISRLKATNIIDKSQAKLMAESGLQLAMARLRLYKEGFNKLQSNPTAKNMVPTQLLNQLWETPFIYPIPVGAQSSAALKETVNKFEKETFLDGEMKVSIQNISNRLNLNMLRIDMTKFNPDGEQREELGLEANNLQNDASVDQSLYFLLRRTVERKAEQDELFGDRYGNINYQQMITNLKFYISDSGSLAQNPLAGEAEINFSRIPLTPKLGPLSSSSELYTIPGWNDELIELIQNEFSVYPSTQIDFNKITANMLRILLPTLMDEQIQDFFLWRDNPEDPKTINSTADFKNYVVNENLMNETDFDARIKLFEDKGISFGGSPNLFKVISEGSYNRATFTLVAYVVLPKKDSTSQKCPPGQIGTPPNCRPRSGEDDKTNPPQDQPTQLLEPRIIELQIN